MKKEESYDEKFIVDVNCDYFKFITVFTYVPVTTCL